MEGHVPVGSRAALRRATRVGDAWAPPAYGFPRASPNARGPVSAKELKADLAWANEQRRALGKRPLECVVSTGVPVKFLERREGGARPSRSEVVYFTARGTPEDLLEEFAAFKEAGADCIEVKLTGDTREEYLRDAETFASRIMPALR